MYRKYVSGGGIPASANGKKTIPIRTPGEKGSNEVNFYINGKLQTVNGEFDVRTTLNDYIRDVAGLKGTKVMCKEGGCGCCAVTVRQSDHTTNQDISFSINSCLCPLYSVDGWQVTTVEGLGSRKEGYHPIQDRIASFNGSQCGYCTPGMVMNMYGLLHHRSAISQQDVEDQFDGNICRCTGYRPILDSMKSFATDSNIQGAKCIDIEDLNKNICPRSGMVCKGDCLQISAGGQIWHRPNTLSEIRTIVQNNKGKSVKFLFGNTVSGIYKNEDPFDIYIDLHEIKEMYQTKKTKNGYEFGANLSISRLIEFLDQKKQEKGFAYFEVLAKHLRKIGNVLVRNAGSWAGNVMIKHAHPDFPSDVFTPMEAAGAHIEVFDCHDGKTKSHPLLHLIHKLEMKNRIIVGLELSPQDDKTQMMSFKVMPRSQNAHAYVNAGFRLTVDNSKGKDTIHKPSLVFGGINGHFIHAVKTEALLNGKTVNDQATVKAALDTLASELEPTSDPVLASPQYRRSLAVNLLYKFLLRVGGAKQTNRASGPLLIERPISHGYQEFQKHESEYPMKEAMPKLASHAQASGEAEFINDMPAATNELYGAFVISARGPATIAKVDTSKALKVPGVFDYVDAQDIPNNGANNCIPTILFMQFAPEEVFCSGKILYAGQQIGMILAESQALADLAAEKVEITYSDVKTPITSIEQAMEKESYHANPMAEHKVGDPENALINSAKTISGQARVGPNYHFYLENQVTRVVPSEERLDVFPASQFAEVKQGVVSQVLGLPVNNINVTVPRLGGSFGGKSLPALYVTAGVSVAAYKHTRPVRSSVTLSTNMKMAGKRYPILAKYEAGFDENGKLNVVSMDVYCDGGATPNGMFALGEIISMMDEGYFCPNWRVKVIVCKTDKPCNTSMRAPSPFPACFIIESVLEQVAKSLNKNPVEVKELNLYQEGQMDIKGHELTYCTMRKVWSELMKWGEIEKRQREISDFNKNNQWKKRAVTVTPAKYGMHYMGFGITVDIAIYSRDGTITVSQGGIEMGQGLYTKVAQAVASSLGVPISTVKVLPTNSHTAANSAPTGGSIGSEISVMSALKCCEILKERMAPIREKHPDFDWKNLLKMCELAGVELTAKNKCPARKKEGPGEFQYFSYAAGATEVELDVLTGEQQIRRVDMVYDCGESLNPDIDIGQIEGSYVMGAGNILLEDIIYDKDTGAVLNDGTWEYKPPTTKDIPVDIRVKLLPDAPNPFGVLSSKASGEPAILLANGAFHALRQAVEAARAELTGDTQYNQMIAPLTHERLMLGCGVTNDKLLL